MSTVVGLFQESGPCEVVEMADGTYGTQARLWGWDRSSNIIYIDQPTQVGFSYDTLTNWTYNAWKDAYEPTIQGPLTPSWRWMNGTFGSINDANTANTTEIAANAIWHFLQGWLSAFPQYNPGTRPNSTSTKPAGVHLVAESYGGLYGPTFADFFEEQNTKREIAQLPPNSTIEIELNSLSIINGLVDQLIQLPYYPKFANNNTYDIVALSTTDMMNDLSDFIAPGGCQALIQNCRNLAMTLDSAGNGDEETVNKACSEADDSCGTILNHYAAAGRNYYDIRDKMPQSFPSDAYLEYLNTVAVQKSIGAAVNFTSNSKTVFTNFRQTGDDNRGTQLQSLSKLLSQGIRIAFIYGDADYICNWFGGEAISLALAGLVPGYNTEFPAAGYAELVVNSTYVGGAVRQYGNLSFSRIYDSGHLVPAYQPETAFTLFTRIIQGAELSTGEPRDLSTFASTGPANATYTNDVPDQAADVCWIRDPLTCTDDQQTAALDGQGVVINGVWYKDKSDYKPPSSTIQAGVPGTLPASSASSSAAGKSSSTVAATGVYTATATPTKKSAGTRAMAAPIGFLLFVPNLMMILGVLFA